MRNKFYSFFILWFIAFNGNSQNLVSNPSFEIFSTCPNTTSQVQFATGWNTSQNSPDYYDACAGTGSIVNMPDNICGYQQAASGDGEIGILCYGSFASGYIANLREYATGTLTTPLTIGSTYSVSFKVALMNMSSHTVDHVGAKFMTSYIPNLAITNSAQVFSSVVISDTLNWTTISGTFVADSAYNFILIGNHFDDASSVVTMIQPVTFGWNAYYFVDDVEVTEINQTPVALFSAPNHICPGTCADFTNMSLNATSYLWTFNGANPSTSTDVNPSTICYNSPGTYSVSLIATNSFSSDTLTLNNYITVYPYPAPQGIHQSGDTLFANQGATSYQWYFNGNIINGATDYFYLATASGDYNVVATDENGCEVEAVINNVIAAVGPPKDGFDEANSSSMQSIQVYPNPVGTELIIRNEELRIGTAVTISIYNLFGEKVLAVQLPTANCSRMLSGPTCSVDVSGLSPGMYLLDISAEGKTFRAKFVKH